MLADRHRHKNTNRPSDFPKRKLTREKASQNDSLYYSDYFPSNNCYSSKYIGSAVNENRGQNSGPPGVIGESPVTPGDTEFGADAIDLHVVAASYMYFAANYLTV